MSDDLALLKRQWELGIISGEDYFIEKTRLTSTTKVAAGAAAAVGAHSVGSSKAVKLLFASTLGSAVVGATGIGLYAFTHTSRAPRTEPAIEAPLSPELEAISSEGERSHQDYRVPFGPNFARTDPSAPPQSMSAPADGVLSSANRRPVELESTNSVSSRRGAGSSPADAAVYPRRPDSVNRR
ncbi:hypothetical protein [Sphingobium subterraneum]|uniref:Uncharacterized protein n=1 Tax=Sphingobium subterraneum TaxID=627688 RepID=A0A841J7H4_9SPHN|nr:hypothetical protein [Sphingobium subterraneum]MBB6124508.1 hypothetical protein [Sphingobium subterraneum]